MQDHLMREMIGLIGRIETIEQRQGRSTIPIISAMGASKGDDETKVTVAKLVKCVETMQGQIEWIMDKFEEWNVED